MLTFEERVVGGNSLQRSGSGSEPDPEPNREIGPVANTTFDVSNSFVNWALPLENEETWEQEDSKTLWEKELKGEGKKGKPYGVDTRGMWLTQCYLVSL